MKSDRQAYLLLCLTMSFWAGNFILGRGVHAHVPPIALATMRWTLASLFILPVAINYLREDWPVIRKNLPILIFFGTIGVGAFNTLQYSGLNYTSSLNGLVLQSSAPLCIVLASFLLFGDRIALHQAIGIAVSSLGVLVVLAKGDLEKLLALHFGFGDLLLIIGVICWAIYTAVLRKRPNIHFLSFAAVTFIIGATVNMPLWILEMSTGRTLHADLTTVLSIAYVSIFPSVLAYIFYNKGVEIIGPARAGSFIHLVPFIGGALAIALLGEEPRLYHLAGFGLILAGVWLTAHKA